MLLEQSESFSVFGGCLIAGLSIGLLYDVLSLFRLPFRSVFVDALFDVIFYILSLCISAVALLYWHDGRIRLYALTAIALGAYLYLRLPSQLFRTLARRLFKICSK
ncbi:MAG: spore cortex biosynthesis protein YabQ [Eubacteriales bacterium]|nr:spore cortex biosynthesis protein YabQ [Eubacteriales bacterium]